MSCRSALRKSPKALSVPLGGRAAWKRWAYLSRNSRQSFWLMNPRILSTIKMRAFAVMRARTTFWRCAGRCHRVSGSLGCQESSICSSMLLFGSSAAFKAGRSQFAAAVKAALDSPTSDKTVQSASSSLRSEFGMRQSRSTNVSSVAAVIEHSKALNKRTSGEHHSIHPITHHSSSMRRMATHAVLWWS